MSPAKSNVATATAAWGEDLPTWVLVLARACDADSQNKAAHKVKYSHAVINQVLKNTYNGDLNKVQKAVEGAYLDTTVDCPGFNQDIPTNRCIAEQRKPLRTTSPALIKLWRACNGGCEHFINKKGSGDGK